MATLEELARLRHQASTARRTARELAEQTADTFARTAEVAVSSLVCGYLQGHETKPLFGSVPPELAIAGAGLLAGIFLDEKLGTHAMNVGTGALASYLTAVGQGMGAKALAVANAKR